MLCTMHVQIVMRIANQLICDYSRIFLPPLAHFRVVTRPLEKVISPDLMEMRIRIKKATYSCGKGATHSYLKKASYSYAKDPFINATNTEVMPWL